MVDGSPAALRTSPVTLTSVWPKRGAVSPGVSSRAANVEASTHSPL